MTVTTRQMTNDDLPGILGLELRDTDKKELQALRPGKTMGQILGETIMAPDVNVALLDGEIIGLFGALPLNTNPEFGVIWSFGTNKAYTVMDELNVLAVTMIDKWLSQYHQGIGNVMSLLNNPAVEWIKGFGFEFEGREMSINGTPFRKFARYNNV